MVSGIPPVQCAIASMSDAHVCPVILLSAFFFILFWSLSPLRLGWRSWREERSSRWVQAGFRVQCSAHLSHLNSYLPPGSALTLHMLERDLFGILPMPMSASLLWCDIRALKPGVTHACHCVCPLQAGERERKRERETHSPPHPYFCIWAYSINSA